ncbi:MAG: hypothetical protein BWY63_03103 [Chloroflexi bacterium ADurb.Bin360]|nr:MAG: hypothetical protein BWY63_03103 [Chloroflexi bacterium ADurb.Bin360]
MEHAGLIQLRIHRLHECQFLSQWYSEGIDGVRAFEGCSNGIFLRQADGESDAFGGDTGVIQCFVEQRAKLVGIRGSREAPGTLVEHPHTYTAFAGGTGFFEIPVPHHQVVGLFHGVPPRIHVMRAGSPKTCNLLL